MEAFDPYGIEDENPKAERREGQRGRPELPEEERRTVKVMVYLTPEQARRIDAMAKPMTTRANWMFQAALERLDREEGR